ncbi:MAG: hypothetical protein HQM13_04325 [SAR324 cluster bacterium]|nr:hypothetical protein [SAR324 cluster bacterium]
MIQQGKNPPAETVAHTTNLKAILQSLLRFQDETSPKNLSSIDPTSIIYINYKKVIEMVQNTLSMIKSEVVGIDPGELKDTLYIVRLSINFVHYQLNLADTRIEHLKEYLESRLSWQRYVPWSRTHDAFQRYQELQENQKKSKVLLGHLNRAHIQLRYTIRQSALAIVKTEVTSGESQYIAEIENLELSRLALLELQYEIEDQLDRAQKSRKIIYYEADRSRIFNKLHAANLAINTFTSQLKKLQLDDSLISAEMIQALYFNEKKGFKWRFSDKHVFTVLCEHQVELKNFIERTDLILQQESHKLNLMANQVTPLGFLLKYSPGAITAKAINSSKVQVKNEVQVPKETGLKIESGSQKNTPAQQNTSKSKLVRKAKPELGSKSEATVNEDKSDSDEPILRLDLEEIDLERDS